MYPNRNDLVPKLKYFYSYVFKPFSDKSVKKREKFQKKKSKQSWKTEHFVNLFNLPNLQNVIWWKYKHAMYPNRNMFFFLSFYLKESAPHSHLCTALPHISCAITPHCLHVNHVSSSPNGSSGSPSKCKHTKQTLLLRWICFFGAVFERLFDFLTRLLDMFSFVFSCIFSFSNFFSFLTCLFFSFCANWTCFSFTNCRVSSDVYSRDGGLLLLVRLLFGSGFVRRGKKSLIFFSTKLIQMFKLFHTNSGEEDSLPQMFWDVSVHSLQLWTKCFSYNKNTVSSPLRRNMRNCPFL